MPAITTFAALLAVHRRLLAGAMLLALSLPMLQPAQAAGDATALPEAKRDRKSVV